MKRKYVNPMRERLRIISSAKFGRKIFINKVLKGDSKVIDMLDKIGRILGLSSEKQYCTTGHDGEE